MQITSDAYLFVTSDVAVLVQQPYRGRFDDDVILPAFTFRALRRYQGRGRGHTRPRDLHGKSQGESEGWSGQQQPTAVVLVNHMLKRVS